ncbi:MAG: topoisomerase II, partial [Actinobacteria bacterium]
MSKRRKSPRTAAPQRQKLRDVFIPRPFAGLADEPEWIALRELVPAASAPLRLTPALVEQYGDRPVTLATVLPMAWPAMTKPDGRV